MLKVIDFLFLGDNIAFLVAGAAVIAILLFELLAMMIGGSLHMLGGDSDFDFDKGDIGGVLDWLNPGQVPLIILLTVFLGSFAVCGYTIQWIVKAMGFPLIPWLVAAPVVTVVALPFVRVTSSVFAKVIPRETTNAVSVDSLLGYYGKVTLGPVTHDLMGQAKFKDDHGVTHYLEVVCEDGAFAHTGDDVVLLNRFADDSYIFVIRKI